MWNSVLARRGVILCALILGGCGVDLQAELGETEQALESYEHCRSVSAPVGNWWRGAGKRDVTLVAFGDSQFTHGGSRDAINRKHVDVINRVESLRWPTGFRRAGMTFRKIRGVVVAGDLTHDGDAKGRTWSQFVKKYGLCGDGRLRYPVFEGWGNHEYQRLKPFDYPHPILAHVARRNGYRKGLKKRSPRGHYSWEWDDVHFVNLNVKAGDNFNTEIAQNGDYRRIDPKRPLDFLARDLAQHVAGTNKRVVIMTHYPSMVGEPSRLLSIIRSYRVIAFIHGHAHTTSTMTWSGYPVFNLGAPYPDFESNGGRGHFTVFRIGRNWLEAVDVGWRGLDPSNVRVGHRWARRVRL